jgi:CubicO group peptidase (beta-lactamase class C family)
MKKIFILLSMILITAKDLNAQENRTIDADGTDGLIIRLKDSLKVPGIAAGIIINDKIVYEKTFGYSDIENSTELTTNSVWHICSVSKQFSTVACLKLAEENRLSLNDKISRYIDNLPQEYSDITIFNLLSHTSGIKDYLNEKNLFGLPWEKVKSEILSDTLNFKPGTAWKYSNTGFWIVARIIEKITGIDYNQYLERTFFTNLHMDHTHRISEGKTNDQRVNGYHDEDGKQIKTVLNSSEFYGQGDGDLISTLPDLIKWNVALTEGKIIQKESVSKLWNPSKLDDGQTLETIPDSGVMYGLGWFIGNIDGEKIVWTPGAGFGFSMSSLYVPEYNLTIIVFCNKDQFLMADEIGFSIARNILR